MNRISFGCSRFTQYYRIILDIRMPPPIDHPFIYGFNLTFFRTALVFKKTIFPVKTTVLEYQQTSCIVSPNIPSDEGLSEARSSSTFISRISYGYLYALGLNIHCWGLMNPLLFHKQHLFPSLIFGVLLYNNAQLHLLQQ